MGVVGHTIDSFAFFAVPHYMFHSIVVRDVVLSVYMCCCFHRLWFVVVLFLSFFGVVFSIHFKCKMILQGKTSFAAIVGVCAAVRVLHAVAHLSLQNQ